MSSMLQEETSTPNQKGKNKKVKRGNKSKNGKTIENLDEEKYNHTPQGPFTGDLSNADDTETWRKYQPTSTQDTETSGEGSTPTTALTSDKHVEKDPLELPRTSVHQDHKEDAFLPVSLDLNKTKVPSKSYVEIASPPKRRGAGALNGVDVPPATKTALTEDNIPISTSSSSSGHPLRHEIYIHEGTKLLRPMPSTSPPTMNHEEEEHEADRSPAYHPTPSYHAKSGQSGHIHTNDDDDDGDDEDPEQPVRMATTTISEYGTHSIDVPLNITQSGDDTIQSHINTGFGDILDSTNNTQASSIRTDMTPVQQLKDPKQKSENAKSYHNQQDTTNRLDTNGAEDDSNNPVKISPILNAIHDAALHQYSLSEKSLYGNEDLSAEVPLRPSQEYIQELAQRERGEFGLDPTSKHATDNTNDQHQYYGSVNMPLHRGGKLGATHGHISPGATPQEIPRQLQKRHSTHLEHTGRSRVDSPNNRLHQRIAALRLEDQRTMTPPHKMTHKVGDTAPNTHTPIDTPIDTPTGTPPGTHTPAKASTPSETKTTKSLPHTKRQISSSSGTSTHSMPSKATTIGAASSYDDFVPKSYMRPTIALSNRSRFPVDLTKGDANLPSSNIFGTSSPRLHRSTTQPTTRGKHQGSSVKKPATPTAASSSSTAGGSGSGSAAVLTSSRSARDIGSRYNPFIPPHEKYTLPFQSDHLPSYMRETQSWKNRKAGEASSTQTHPQQQQRQHQHQQSGRSQPVSARSRTPLSTSSSSVAPTSSRSASGRSAPRIERGEHHPLPQPQRSQHELHTHHRRTPSSHASSSSSHSMASSSGQQASQTPISRLAQIHEHKANDSRDKYFKTQQAIKPSTTINPKSSHLNDHTHGTGPLHHHAVSQQRPLGVSHKSDKEPLDPKLVPRGKVMKTFPITQSHDEKYE